MIQMTGMNAYSRTMALTPHQIALLFGVSTAVLMTSPLPFVGAWCRCAEQLHEDDRDDGDGDEDQHRHRRADAEVEPSDQVVVGHDRDAGRVVRAAGEDVDVVEH